MVTFRDARSVLLALTLVSVVATATAARFPDTVQRTFVVEGAPARELAAPFLSVLVSLIYDYAEERWVYRATLGLDDRKPGVRAAVSAMHEALMRQLKRDVRY